MSNVIMDKARAVINGQDITVILPEGRQYAGEARYDAKIHKGALKCLFCDAAVHYHKGSSIIAGQYHLRGAAAHFHTNPGQRHENTCRWQRPEQEKSAVQYDKSAGFRLHLNAHGFTGDFNAAANPLYRRNADHKLVVTEEAARHMETMSLHSVADLVNFLRLKDPLRINASRIILNEYDIPWQDFMLRYNTTPKATTNRFMTLVDRLSATCRKTQPVLMEMDVRRPVYPRNSYDKIPPVFSKDIFWRRAIDSVTHVIRPAVHLKNRHDTRVSLAFSSAGKYLVLGMAHVRTRAEDHGPLHFVNIDITDYRQVSKISLADIAAENRKRFPR